MGKRNQISVSQLSAYAADPAKFCSHRGRAYDAAAAKQGDKAHSRAGGSSPLWWLVKWLCIGLSAWFFYEAGLLQGVLG
ncbi:hypothetical protein K0504_09620 [Neiella marina]|uniref:Uncharacterized protein n=1 Tax=Neiella holothuriorum TaxID=2870530 RepID=A0ABS7EGG3_9GAMM|nr:hypothetical protein [Neiella holothuriorum]MBW8191294.1 hypothetical protein [Neiella holothuriorum]